MKLISVEYRSGQLGVPRLQNLPDVQLPIKSPIEHLNLFTMSSTKNLFSALTLEDPVPKPAAAPPKKKGKKKQTILSLYEPPVPTPAAAHPRHHLRSTFDKTFYHFYFASGKFEANEAQVAICVLLGKVKSETPTALSPKFH